MVHKVLTVAERLQMIGFLREFQMSNQPLVRLVNKNGMANLEQGLLPIDVTPFRVLPDTQFWYYLDSSGKHSRSARRFVNRVSNDLDLEITTNVATSFLKTVCGSCYVTRPSGQSDGTHLGSGLVYVGAVPLPHEDIELFGKINAFAELRDAVAEYIEREEDVRRNAVATAFTSAPRTSLRRRNP